MQQHLNFSPPEPLASESPTEYADKIGTWYVASKDELYRKNYGLYLTPTDVAGYMGSMLEPRKSSNKNFRLLDPAAGAGILLCSSVEALIKQGGVNRIEITTYEIDPDLEQPLTKVMKHLTSWASERGVIVSTKICMEDFLITNAHFLEKESLGCFDAVIANPPYFKINKGDPRAVAAKSVVHGQPNIYGLFMAVAAVLLSSDGDFVFITPRSFTSGPYFRRFREVFFELVEPTRVHVFGSRREAFSRDEILQENVILYAKRRFKKKKSPSRTHLIISSSAGAADLGTETQRKLPLEAVLDLNSKDKNFCLPSTLEEEEVLKLVGSWNGSLHRYGLEISTGPVVPFRSTEWLRQAANGQTVPLIWMNHVRAMDIHWPNGIRKPQYILANRNAEKLLVPNRNYVLLRRFSAKEEKRRLVAAPFLSNSIESKMIGLENHLNYIHRPEGEIDELEVWGLAALYSSSLLDTYFRCVNGNTQVSATELRAMPLPPHSLIMALGKYVKASNDPLRKLDQWLEKLLSTSEENIIEEKFKAVG